MNTESLIESILFYKSGSVRIGELVKILGKERGEIEEAFKALEKTLENRGIRLIIKDDEVALATSPLASKLIESLRKEELSGDLGKATLETLTIILYRAPILKSEIDYIRGVNSDASLRTLLVRGLVERKKSDSGGRSFSYTPSIDTLSYLGISQIKELPEYEKVRQEVESFRKDTEEKETLEDKKNEEASEE